MFPHILALMINVNNNQSTLIKENYMSVSENSQSKEISNAANSKFVSSSSAEALSAQGFEGLVFDYASFPVIALNGRSFVMNDNDEFDPKEFNVKIIRSHSKYILVDAKDSKYEEVRYSYDGVATTEGELLSDCKQKMIEEDRVPTIKTYLDILVQLKMEGTPYDDMLAVLQISPTSVSKISGFLFQLELQNKLENLGESIMKVSKGKLKTSKTGHAYHLWNMSVAEVKAIDKKEDVAA